MSTCLIERGNFTEMNKVFDLLPLGYMKKLFMRVVPPCPLGTCRRSITTEGQYVWSFSPFPHIKLSLCQISCHQIWCCKEIAIIFISFFLWPFDFIQSSENPSRWFREHVSSKSIGPTTPDSFLLFSPRARAIHVLKSELFFPGMDSKQPQLQCICSAI